MLRKSLLTTTLVGAAFLSIAPAKAAVITWGLGTPSGLLGDSQDYTAGSPPVTITATGFTTGNFSGPQTALFGKNLGGDEVGLGLADDPSGQDEITGTNWVQLNVTNAIAAGVTGLSFIMNSTTGCTAVPCTTGGDSWRVFGSNSATSLGTQLPGLIGFDEGVSHPLPTGFDFFNFQGVTGNVLISSISGNQVAVPESSTWAMMLLGFAGLGFAGYRKAKTRLTNSCRELIGARRNRRFERPPRGGLSVFGYRRAGCRKFKCDRRLFPHSGPRSRPPTTFRWRRRSR